MKDPALNWAKSSYSSSGNCIEVADQAGRVLVRDSKQDGIGPVLRFGVDAWRRLTDELKAR
jgi:hypothetical protein